VSPAISAPSWTAAASWSCAQDWYASPGYAPALEIRRTALRRNLIFMDGLSP